MQDANHRRRLPTAQFWLYAIALQLASWNEWGNGTREVLVRSQH